MPFSILGVKLLIPLKISTCLLSPFEQNYLLKDVYKPNSLGRVLCKTEKVFVSRARISSIRRCFLLPEQRRQKLYLKRLHHLGLPPCVL
jgi:hypothetical protein